MDVDDGVDSLHPTHELLHELHAHIQHEGNKRANHAQGHEVDLDIGLNEILRLFALSGNGMLSALVLQVVVVLEPGSGPIVVQDEPDGAEHENGKSAESKQKIQD
jgi:ABC-type proline/glycine betaine transport system ATPase subunit